MGLTDWKVKLAHATAACETDAQRLKRLEREQSERGQEIKRLRKQVEETTIVTPTYHSSRYGTEARYVIETRDCRGEEAWKPLVPSKGDPYPADVEWIAGEAYCQTADVVMRVNDVGRATYHIVVPYTRKHKTRGRIVAEQLIEQKADAERAGERIDYEIERAKREQREEDAKLAADTIRNGVATCA